MSYFIALNLPLLMMNRLMQGIALGVASTATGTIIAQILPPERRGEGIGYYSLSAILATAIGPFIGILLTQLFEDYRMIFAVDSVLAVVCFMMYFMVTVPDAPKNTKRMAEKLGFKLSSFIELRALPIAFVALVIGFAYSGVMSFMTFYAKRASFGNSRQLLLYRLCTRYFSNSSIYRKLLDARGANIIIYPCLILFAMGMYAFSTATSTVVFLIAAAFIGIGYGNFNSVAQAIAIKVTPHERLGLATSTYFILYDLGLGVGPYFLGLFAPTMGYSAIFLSMVVVIFVSIVLYYFLYGKYEKVKQVNI